MLPVNNTDIDLITLQPLEMPSRTYHFELLDQQVRGFTDQQEAMRQAIYKIIYTERYVYPIYSRNYGAELDGLIGQPIPYILSEVKRRVSEALLHDNRITAVENWDFNVQRGKVTATYTARTIYGDIDADAEVFI